MQRFAPLALFMAMALAGCGDSDGDSAPTGQVVATVDGEEITASELRLEIPQGASDPAMAAAAQQNALNSLISRKLLVAEAKRQELEGSPLAAMVRKRAEDLAMVQLLQLSVAGGVPKVSDNEVAEFISSHPSTFSQRRLISVDQLLIPSAPEGLAKELSPLNSFEAIETALAAKNIGFVRSATVLDTLNLDPSAADTIGQMANGTVFLSPGAEGGLQASRIASSRVEPLTGDEAKRVARLLLTQRRNTAQVRTALEDVIKRGQPKVKINEAYTAAPAAGKTAPAK